MQPMAVGLLAALSPFVALALGSNLKQAGYNLSTKIYYVLGRKLRSEGSEAA